MVVLCNQDIKADELKRLFQRMGELTGKPGGKLHINSIHPEINRGLGNDQVLSDPEVYVVSSEVCTRRMAYSQALKSN